MKAKTQKRLLDGKVGFLHKIIIVQFVEWIPKTGWEYDPNDHTWAKDGDYTILKTTTELLEIYLNRSNK